MPIGFLPSQTNKLVIFFEFIIFMASPTNISLFANAGYIELYIDVNVGLDIENKYNTKYRSNGFVEGEEDEEDLPVVVDLNASMF